MIHTGSMTVSSYSMTKFVVNPAANTHQFIQDVEYTGIWVIAVVMTIGGMEAALLAGIICALLTFAIQSVAYPKPIRGSMTAATLRSSEWNRCPRAFEILDSPITGRMRILVVQFQGHLFFG